MYFSLTASIAVSYKYSDAKNSFATKFFKGNVPEANFGYQEGVSGNQLDKICL